MNTARESIGPSKRSPMVYLVKHQLLPKTSFLNYSSTKDSIYIDDFLKSPGSEIIYFISVRKVPSLKTSATSFFH